MKDLFGNPDEEAIQRYAEAMYQQAAKQPLSLKIEMALLFLKSHEQLALTTSGEGADVANSGGKDSIVTLDLVRRSGIKHFSHYGNTTIDPPELVRFLKDNYPDTKWINTGRHLTLSTVDHASGLPTRRGKWCCDIYKHNHGRGVQVVGIRAAESPRRKGLWKQVNTMSGNVVLAPILYWTDADVWQYIKDNNLPYCSLYDEVDSNGKKLFTRLGCVGCPNGKREKEFKRWPKYEALWKQGGRLWWDKYHNKLKADDTFYFAHKFPTFEAYWSWWMEEKNVNDTDNPDCQSFLW